MAVSETKILFEGFLQKRKDTLRVRWVTYWFRLQNTTLFFYTKKNGNALNLRGNYYIYTVQSVREVYRTNSKRFMFEINMNNGKRKLLAAETTELRQRWVEHLWQAMHLSRLWTLTSRSTQSDEQEVCAEQQQKVDSDETESLPFSVSEDYSPYNIRRQPSHTNLPETQFNKNIQPASAEVSAEALYDFLPRREDRCPHDVQTEMESLYDVPVSNRMALPQPVATENIYDVPRSLLRKIPDHTLAFSSEEQRNEEAYWRI